MRITLDTDVDSRDLLNKLNKVFKTSPYSLKVGFFTTATYPSGVSVSTVAQVHNEGAPAHGIPRRPFFTNAILKNNNKWFSTFKKSLKKYPVKTSIKRLGMEIQKDIQTSITNTNSPRNTVRTILRKRSSNPLIDTGFLRRSVTYELKKGRI